MERLNEVLKNVFDVTMSDTFERKATYNPAMDCVEYVSADEVAVAFRIDGFLTLYKDRNRQRVIGFKCKGFRYVFEKLRQQGAPLEEKHFLPIVKLIEAALTEIGDQVCDEEKRAAYDEAMRIASNDDVKLEIPPDMAA